MPVTTFDVPRARGLYPTVGAGTAHLDGPFGALQPESVIRAIVYALRSSMAQPGSHSARSRLSAGATDAARAAVADLVGGAAGDVVLGPSLLTLMQQFTAAAARDWVLADEIVISRLDASSVAAPLLAAARERGATVRWAEVDLETGELPTWQYEKLIAQRTRVVTVPLANAATGTVPEVRAIADLAHRFGALVVVDVAAALPHLPVDLKALGADLIGLSAARFGGPNLATLVGRPGLFAELGGSPERTVDVGPLAVELLGGLTAAVDHLAELDEDSTGSRRQRLVKSLSRAGEYEASLYPRLDSGLRAIDGVTVLGSSPNRVPVVAFTVAGRKPAEVAALLERQRVSVWSGGGELDELMAAFGVDELGGAVYAGLAPYTTVAEIDQLLAALESGLR